MLKIPFLKYIFRISVIQATTHYYICKEYEAFHLDYSPLAFAATSFYLTDAFFLIYFAEKGPYLKPKERACWVNNVVTFMMSTRDLTSLGAMRARGYAA